jgi:uncharacterized repeat protein (TIGR01451 family)
MGKATRTKNKTVAFGLMAGLLTIALLVSSIQWSGSSLAAGSAQLEPALTLILEASSDPVDAGENLIYQIQYNNRGKAPVHGAYVQLFYDPDVTFVGGQPDPSSATDDVWKIGTVPGGKGGSIDVEVSVTDFMQDQTVLVTEATIWSDETAEFSAEQRTLVNAPELALSKQAAPDPAYSDEQLVYTLVFVNVGHAVAAGVALTDAVPRETEFVSCEPAGCSHSDGVVAWGVGDVAAEFTTTATMVVNIPENVAGGTTLTNTARIRVLDKPEYSATARVETTVVGSRSLGLTISNGQDSVEAGDILEYVLTYRNHGEGTARNTTIEATPPSPQLAEAIDCRPSSSCQVQEGRVVYDVGPLPAGESDAVRLFVKVPDPLPAGARSIRTTAVIDADRPDGVRESYNADDEDDIATRPDLVVTAPYEDTMPWPGKRVTYAVTYNNRGHIASTGVELEAIKPAYTAFRPGASDSCWVPQGDDRFSCHLDELDYGERGGAVFVVALPDTAFTLDTTDFDATFTIQDDGRSGEDGKPEDNTFSAPLGVPNLKVAGVVAELPIWAGKSGRLIVSVLNDGSGPACGVYNPYGCTGFALDLFLDPATPPVSYPIEGYGDCYVFVDPVVPGLSQTAVITFTSDPALLNRSGYCAARMLEGIWLKVDNWDPAQPPYPAEFGLVPESNEGDNVLGPYSRGPAVFLPILIHSD